MFARFNKISAMTLQDIMEINVTDRCTDKGTSKKYAHNRFSSVRTGPYVPHLNYQQL